MYKLQRMLLALTSFFFTATLLAQTNINIEINGIEKPLEDNVKLFLSIEQQKNHALMSEARLHRLHKKARQEIINALQPFGYYRPLVKTELTQTTPDQWQAIYTVDAGPPIPISESNIIIGEEMRSDPAFEKLIRNHIFLKGQTFNHLEYESFKTNLAQLAAESGYFNARFSQHRVDIDLDTYEARIYLKYDGGSRYYFGEVVINQDVLNHELLQRYIPFTQGTPYTLNSLIDFQQALNDSYYFQTVEVSPGQPLHANNEIPIKVNLTPRQRHQFSIGLGYGTDTGARAKFGWEMPRINKSGHRFDTEANVSEIGYSLISRYRVPVLNPRTDQLVYRAGIVNEKTDTSESTLRSIGVSLKHSRKDWRETISLNYQQEDYIVGDDSGVSILLIPGINWSRIWGEDFIYAVDGLRFDFDLRGANQSLLSDNDFLQIQSNIKFITSLNKRNRIITRGTAGSTWSDEFNELPTSVRFFAGGAQSVRGYAYQSLSPVDGNGEVVGGKYLLTGSIEFEHSFPNKWGAAVFYDAGNAIDDLDDKLVRGAGFGLRWKSPVGSVRIDIATALNLDGNPWRLHISIGPDL